MTGVEVQPSSKEDHSEVKIERIRALRGIEEFLGYFYSALSSDLLMAHERYHDLNSPGRASPNIPIPDDVGFLRRQYSEALDRLNIGITALDKKGIEPMTKYLTGVHERILKLEKR